MNEHQGTADHPQGPHASAAAPATAVGFMRRITLQKRSDDSPGDPFAFEVGLNDRLAGMIPPSAVVEGSLRLTEGLVIKGTINGDVSIDEYMPGHGGTLVVHESGHVNGTITAHRVIVMGKAKSVVAKSTLLVGPAGVITDSVEYADLVMAPGAEVEGTMRRIRGDRAAAAVQPQARAPESNIGTSQYAGGPHGTPVSQPQH